ncbi:hypothetical protein ACFP3U_28340 [Kitasatospora misakiensis]|uniref:Uncharacterized protein n=1 Tax=Kitasatospora misakiensis TaxID=67330 RepID=A0ABW0XC16_9ACTN
MAAESAHLPVWHDARVESGARAADPSSLGDLLMSLRNGPLVSVRYGRLPDGATPDHRLGSVAGLVHGLVAEIHPVWERHLATVGVPSTTSQVEARLKPLAADEAIETMTKLAAEDLVWPGRLLMNREIAHHTVTRIVKWLGPGATWWTNRQSGSWDPVTACTFDGVVAGSDGEYFAILIQLGED